MGLEAKKEEDHGPIIIEIANYDNLDLVLSKIVIPFSEVLGTSNVPDVYMGYEKIPFKKRDPLYQTIMRQEFGKVVRVLKNDTKKRG